MNKFFITNDGVKINYIEHGTGKPIVLIGGWTITIAWWSKQIKSLANNNFRVIAIDPRAYGNSEKVLHGHHMARHAMDVHNLLTTFNLNNVTVIGWSLGANVLLSYWELFQNDRIDSIIHIDQSPCCINQKNWQLGFKLASDENALQEFYQDFTKNRKNVSSSLIDNWYAKQLTPEEKAWMLREVMKTPIEAAISIVKDHLSKDWRDIVPTVQIPVMIATGRQSKIFPWQSGAWLAQTLPRSRHVIFEQSGHCPFQEEPEKFNYEVCKFIKSI